MNLERVTRGSYVKSEMRVDLSVPFDERHKAKALGARWDVARRIWYIIDPDDLRKFSKWMDKDVQKFFSSKSEVKAN